MSCALWLKNNGSALAFRWVRRTLKRTRRNFTRSMTISRSALSYTGNEKVKIMLIFELETEQCTSCIGHEKIK